MTRISTGQPGARSTNMHKRAFAIPPSMAIAVQMASAAAAETKRMNQIASATPVAARKITKKRKPPPETWTDVFLELLHPFGTRRSWAAAMLMFGTADMLFNITNLVQMSADDLNYVLVIEPPTRELWNCMCFFTIVGTVLYIPETINTVSAIRSEDGDTLVPFHTELTVTLLVEHIPLSMIDYFIAKSRRYHTSDVQTYCAGVRIVFIIIRLIWYAYIEGTKLQKNKHHELHQVLVLVNYLLFSITVAFPLNNWRFHVASELMPSDLEPVSVYMMRYEKSPQGTFTSDITYTLAEQGWTENNATLVHNTWVIYKAYQATGHPVIAYYDCHHGGQQRPRECTRHGARFLRFSFVYRPDKSISPFGIISYNYAEICLDISANSSSEPDELDSEFIARSPFYPSCYEAKRPLMDGWRLFYFTSERKQKDGEARHLIYKPFSKVHTSTMPQYSAKNVVCSKNMRGLCEKFRKKPTRVTSTMTK